MSGTAAAIGAGIAAVGTVAASAISADASRSASNAQSRAAQSANQTQLYMYDQSRADQAPWRQAGGQAVNALSQWFGLGGINPAVSDAPGSLTAGTLPGYDPSSGYQISPSGAVTQLLPSGSPSAPQGGIAGTVTAAQGGRATATQGMTSSGQPTGQPTTGSPAQPTQPIDYNKLLSSLPGYQFQLSQGENAVQSNLAARGLLQSGAAGKALTEYGQGVAQNYAQQYVGGLQSLAGLGQTSVANTGVLGGNAANQIGGNYLYGGNAQASGYVGGANAINAGLSGLVGAYGQYQTRQQQLYGDPYGQIQPFTPTAQYLPNPYGGGTPGTTTYFGGPD